MKPEIQEALEAHKTKGQPCGEFVTAVLENNLREAVGQADDENLRDLREIVQWCFWEMPAGAWGSEGKVKQWRQAGGLAGMVASAHERALGVHS